MHRKLRSPLRSFPDDVKNQYEPAKCVKKCKVCNKPTDKNLFKEIVSKRLKTNRRTDIAQTYFFVVLCNFVKDTCSRKRFLQCITYFEQPNIPPVFRQMGIIKI